MAFPCTSAPEGARQIAFSSDPRAIRQTIAENPETAFRFTDTIIGYIIHGNPHAARPYAARVR